MQSPNEITAFVVIVMIGLVAWGYRGSLLKAKPETGIEWLMRGILVSALVGLFRSSQWDIVVPVVRALEHERSAMVGIVGNWFNALWNVGLVYACYAKLRGLYMFIPASERDRYSVWTAAFYPRNPLTRRRSSK